MDNWKPYLHTSLFSTPAERNGGEPFLFPTFVVNSTATFLASAGVTALFALVERFLTSLLDPTPSASASASPHAPPPPPKPALYRTSIYFATTLLRYLLMIIAMGMDWFLLLTIVSALSLGQLAIEVRNARSVGRRRADGWCSVAAEAEADGETVALRSVVAGGKEDEEAELALDDEGEEGSSVAGSLGKGRR